MEFGERQLVECEQLDLGDPRDFMVSSVHWRDDIVCIVGKMFAPQACTPEFDPRNPWQKARYCGTLTITVMNPWDSLARQHKQIGKLQVRERLSQDTKGRDTEKDG